MLENYCNFLPACLIVRLCPFYGCILLRTLSVYSYFFFSFFFFQSKAIRENIGYPEYLKNSSAMSEMFKGVSFRLLTISVFWAVNTRFFLILLHDVLPYIFLITSNLQRRIFRKAATYIITLHKIAAKINTLDGKKTRPGSHCQGRATWNATKFIFAITCMTTELGPVNIEKSYPGLTCDQAI